MSAASEDRRLAATPAALVVELAAPLASGGRCALDRDATEALAAAVAQDLERSLGPEVADAGLVLLGGAFDLTEVLRPGLPLLDPLLELYRGALGGGDFQPTLVGVSPADDHFPLQALRPRGGAEAGPLLALPFALVAPRSRLTELNNLLERRLLERGEVSRAALEILGRGLEISPRSAGYATVADLGGILRSQLLHGGFRGLWKLLEAALQAPEGPTEVDTDTGNRYLLLEGRVFAPFLTLDQWIARRLGDQDAYGAWLRTQRQYHAGLEAHGLEVLHVAPDALEAAAPGRSPEPLADQDQLLEVVSGAPEAPAARVHLTEQTLADTGLVAYSIVARDPSGAVAFAGNHYPLRPAAVPRIARHWEEHAQQTGVTLQEHRPGRLLTGADGRLVGRGGADA